MIGIGIGSKEIHSYKNLYIHFFDVHYCLWDTYFCIRARNYYLSFFKPDFERVNKSWSTKQIKYTKCPWPVYFFHLAYSKLSEPYSQTHIVRKLTYFDM